MTETTDIPHQSAEPTAVTGTPLLTYRRLLLLVVVALALIALVLFVADNFVLVQIRLFTLRIQARLAWALIVPLLLGIGIGWTGHGVVARARRRDRRPD
ncbi:MAG: hypothetical protein QM753_02445 [Thermomicrobiales bacterium]